MPSIELIKASDGSAPAAVATVQSTRAAAATTIDVDSVAGINPAGFAGSMGTPHTFTDPITFETITVISEATAVDFTGHVDGVNLEIDDIAPGFVDNGSAIGDIIIIRPTTQYGDNLAETLEVSHADDGSIATNTISEKTPAAGVTVDGVLLKDSKLATNNSVVTNNVTDNAITGPKLSPSAIYLGVGEITATISTNSTSLVDATGMAVTVTVPTGGRDIMIITYLSGLGNTGGFGNYTDLQVMEGATVLDNIRHVAPQNGSMPVTMMTRVAAPSAGSHTYKLQWKVNASTSNLAAGTVGSGSNGPSKMMVLLI